MDADLDDARASSPQPWPRLPGKAKPCTRQSRSRRALGVELARLPQDFRVGVWVDMGDVEDAGGDARIAGIMLAFAFLQHEHAATQLGGTICGGQAGNTGTDDSEIDCSCHDERTCTGKSIMVLAATYRRSPGRARHSSGPGHSRQEQLPRQQRPRAIA